jgi:hypothetical protein
LIAALTLWFNAALLIDGYCWVQWDVWALAPFVFAALLAAADWWFPAGVLIVIGGMLKGQTFLVAPLFVFWPLFELRIGACLRWIAGAGFAAATILWPWLLGLEWTPGWKWVAHVLGAALLTAPWFFWRIKPWPPAADPPIANAVHRLAAWVRRFKSPQLLAYVPVALAAVALILWPVRHLGTPMDRAGLVVLAVLLLCPLLLPWRKMGVWLCLMLGLAVFLAGDMYRGDWSWYTVGFKYGSEKHIEMAMGNNPTLPGLLRNNFGWRDWEIHQTVFSMHLPFSTTPFDCDMKTLMAGIYGMCLLLCAAGCAIHHRRRDARLLVAMIAPWLLFATLLTQMSSRYWVWSAALSAAFVGVSIGTSLFQFLLTAVATILILDRQLYHQDWRGVGNITAFTNHFFPDLAWILMLVALIYLWLAIYPRRRGLE